MFSYTHLIAEAKSKFSPNLKPYSRTHEILDVIELFHHISFDYYTFSPIKIKSRPVLYILKRKGSYQEYLSNVSEYEQSEKENSSHLDSTEDNYYIQESSQEFQREKQNSEEKRLDEERVRKNINDNIVGIQNEEITTEQPENDYLGDLDKEDVVENVNTNAYVDLSKIKENKAGRNENSGGISQVKRSEYESSTSGIPNEMTYLNEKQSKRQSKYKVLEDLQQIKENANVDEKNDTSVKRKGYNRGKKSDTNFKKMYKDTGDIITRSSEDNSPKNVKQNIKKIINNYKNAFHVSLNSQTVSSRAETGKTKDSIKRIIQTEKTNLEKEELQKLQQQIIEIIENNPNIINKELIKTKIQNTIAAQVTSDVEILNTAITEKPKVLNIRSKEFKVKNQKAKGKNKEPNVRNKIMFKDTEGNSDNNNVDMPQEIQKNGNKTFLDEQAYENALDLFEDERSIEDNVNGNKENENDVSYEKPKIHFEDNDNEERHQSTSKYEFELEFQEANDKIDKIMHMIDDIVENLEVTNDNKDS